MCLRLLAGRALLRIRQAAETHVSVPDDDATESIVGYSKARCAGRAVHSGAGGWGHAEEEKGTRRAQEGRNEGERGHLVVVAQQAVQEVQRLGAHEVLLGGQAVKRSSQWSVSGQSVVKSVVSQWSVVIQ